MKREIRGRSSNSQEDIILSHFQSQMPELAIKESPKSKRLQLKRRHSSSSRSSSERWDRKKASKRLKNPAAEKDSTVSDRGDSPMPIESPKRMRKVRFATSSRHKINA
jgi:hypothetical protein